MHTPRGYQLTLENEIYAAWNAGARNVIAVLPTGGGKTFVFSRIAAATKAAVCAIAHRAELVTQMSLALGREGVYHRVIGPKELTKRCVQLHVSELQSSYVSRNAHVAVAGVDTLVRMDSSDPWFSQVQLWIQDEAHHVLADNKWGRACRMFPHARGLGVTATPVRADGKGLGRHADGLADALVLGPSMRDLIRQGYLTDYKVFAPPSDLDLTKVPVTASGDYSPERLRAVRHESKITGDVVKHYLRIAPGKLGVTFDVDVESSRGRPQTCFGPGFWIAFVVARSCNWST
jgi:superfamily II DNA or RNA helicase